MGEMSKVPLPVNSVTNHPADPTQQNQRQSRMSTFHEVSQRESGHGFCLESPRGHPPPPTPELGADEIRLEMKAGLKAL